MFRYLILATLTTICSAAELGPQNIPELLGQPVKYTAEEVLKHIRVVNPGAKVLIYAIDDADMMTWFFNLPPESSGYILGLFRSHEEEAGAMPDIAILGPWNREIGVGVHEYQHLLEYMMPDRRVELRKIFQMLATPDFRIGSVDLEGPAEPDAEVIHTATEFER